MRYIEEAGDLVGTEIWIISATGKHYATVVEASGTVHAPVVAPVQVSGSRVRFEIRTQLVDQDGNPAPDFVEEFNGTVTRSRFTGTLTSYNDSGAVKPAVVNREPFSFKRGGSYWR